MFLSFWFHKTRRWKRFTKVVLLYSFDALGKRKIAKTGKKSKKNTQNYFRLENILSDIRSIRVRAHLKALGLYLVGTAIQLLWSKLTLSKWAALLANFVISKLSLAWFLLRFDPPEGYCRSLILQEDINLKYLLVLNPILVSECLKISHKNHNIKVIFSIIFINIIVPHSHAP